MGGLSGRGVHPIVLCIHQQHRFSERTLVTMQTRNSSSLILYSAKVESSFRI